MKYKVLDEVLVKARIIIVNDEKNMPYTIVREKNLGYTTNSMCVKESDIVKQPEMTAEEAWEIAKKITIIPSCGGYEYVDLQYIFGTHDVSKIMKNNSPQEAKAKIKAWEEQKEIKVGDIIEFEDKILCVTGFASNFCCGMDANGLSYSVNKKDTRKTGRHINIEGLLKQIGGDE